MFWSFVGSAKLYMVDIVTDFLSGYSICLCAILAPICPIIAIFTLKVIDNGVHIDKGIEPVIAFAVYQFAT